MLYAVLLVCSLSAVSASLVLEHTTTSICPGSIASYKCSGAENFLDWVAELEGGMLLWRIQYNHLTDPSEVTTTAMTSDVVGEAVLLSSDTMNLVFASALNVTLSTEDVVVKCEGNGATKMSMLHVACKFVGTVTWLATIPTESSPLTSHNLSWTEAKSSCGM